MAHVHRWEMCFGNVLAFKSKRDDGVTIDVRWYMGDVYSCSACPSMEFRPHKKELSAVPVVMVGEDEIRDAERRTAA